MFHYDQDILVHSIGLWLDAGRKKDFSFVSHAHSDHLNRHGRILATPATIALGRERERFRRASSSRGLPRRSPDEMPLEFRAPLDLGGATVTLYPAGHVLGSAQILVECDGHRLLYSGDFCPEATAAAEGIEIPRADTLIMECTYGLPGHRFPPRESVVADLCNFVEKALARKTTPVCLAYALGKGQEVMRILSESGFAVAAEAETWQLSRVYDSFGVHFNRCRLLDGPPKAKEAVVTPSLARVAEFLGRRRVRTAAVTGWASGGFSYRAASADVRIPLSDHADFDGLMRYVEAVSPEKVYIVHGPAEFAWYLKKAGFPVAPITERTPVVSR